MELFDVLGIAHKISLLEVHLYHNLLHLLLVHVHTRATSPIYLVEVPVHDDSSASVAECEAHTLRVGILAILRGRYAEFLAGVTYEPYQGVVLRPCTESCIARVGVYALYAYGTSVVVLARRQERRTGSGY
jgi:hypothetical protein